MPYPLAILLIFSTVFVLAALFYLYRWYRERQRIKKAMTMPFPDAWRHYLEHTVHYPRLDAEQKRRIERSVLKFIFTKRFVGIGLDVTDEMKVVTAFYACLIVLGKPGYCYTSLKTVLIYSHDFIVKQVQGNGGIFTEGAFVLEGQSNAETVVLSWHEVRKQAYHLTHHNVVVHEFAHELDFEDGLPDGTPPLQRGLYDRWSRIMQRDYAALSQAVTRGRYLEKYKLLGDYAATNEAEFFAVASELFFEHPRKLYRHFPELFNLFRDFYSLDPRDWIPPAEE